MPCVFSCRELAPSRGAFMTNLAERLGSAAFSARMRLESSRSAGHGGSRVNRLAAALSRCGPGLSWAFRLVGLHTHAYRQFHGIQLRINRVAIRRLPQTFNGFRILHLSDLHIDLDPSLAETLAACLTSLEYDLCVITGDFRNETIGPSTAVRRAVIELRRHLHAPVIAVLGNHDFLDMVPPLEAAGIRFLLNENLALRHQNSVLYIAGIDDPNIYRTHDLAKALDGVPPEAPCILLSHSPVIYRELAGQAIDLVLAGHTHGGQICLPGGHILLRNDPSPRHLLRGAWRIGATQGYTSTGTGACGVPLRLFCRPEITLHVLLQPDADGIHHPVDRLGINIQVGDQPQACGGFDDDPA